ncbi:5' nucleotidase, NT5C type [Desulfococcus sp.]|uniref:5' nucleotidase, NT5C type n=1 Tax=Desulfococcus sp. TaxID=2025834 RepID=UPI003D0EBEE1
MYGTGFEARVIDPASLAFDIDGVVADTMRLFIDIAREDYAITHIAYNDITHYMLEDCLDISTAVIGEIIEKLLDGSRDEGLRPLRGAPEVLTRLESTFGPLCFVTARPTPEPIHQWMLKTLSVSASGVDITATGSFEAKADVLRERGRRYFVEDRLETCFDLERAGITPILFRQPWNRKAHPFIEVDSWQALEDLIAF